MAENAATQSAADMRKLAEASNPLLVVQNPIVVNASLGVLAAYLARKWAYGNFRDQFGWASKGPDGKIHYYAVKKDSSGNVVPDTSKEVSNAYLNRILLNLGGVVLGTLLINNTLIEDASADYIGLGVAAGSFANLIMTMFQID
jgi:hypothetical protein